MLSAVMGGGAGVVLLAQPPPAAPAQPEIRITPEVMAGLAAQSPPPAQRPLPDGVLAWDRETAEATVTRDNLVARLTFHVTNVFTAPVTISQVGASCGCTVPRLPPLPWTLQPGETGDIEVVMNLTGKRGTVMYTVNIATDQGFKWLFVKGTIEEPSAPPMSEAERLRNLQIAMVNRQAVFQGQCATCHAAPARGKVGRELYDAACGICHDAPRRASMVPDLRQLGKETTADYWRAWITTSAEGKLMPAFHLDHGGFLTSVEIETIVRYLTTEFTGARGTAEPPETGQP